jgi:hypothetical protein
MSDDGDLRRPPLLWQQRLAAMLGSSGIQGPADSIVVNDATPGPGGPGEEPTDPPVLDEDPETPRTPEPPLLAGGIGGLVVFWSGTDTDGLAYPPGVYVEVHVSDTTGVTPSDATFAGTITNAGRLDITGLTSGTTYYVRLIVVLLDGTKLDPTAEESETAGFVLNTNIGQGEITPDLVSFDASAIGGIQQFVGTTAPAITNAGTANQLPKNGSTWINTSNGSYYTLTNGAWVQRQWSSAAIATGAISTLQLAAGAITADSAIIANGAIGTAKIQDAAITDAKIVSLTANKLTAGTINASQITVTNLNASNITSGSLSGDRISGGTIVGSTFVTRGDGFRVRLKDGGAGGQDHLEFLSGSTVRGRIFANNLLMGIEVPGDLAIFNLSSPPAFGNLQVNNLGAAGSSQLDGRIFALDCFNNPQAGNDEVGINTNFALRRLSSSQAIKYDIATLSGDLSTAVDDERQVDVVTVDPADLLDVAVVEYSAIDDGEPSERRLVGFIAEDMAEKFSLGATRDAQGNPSGIQTQGVLAALVAIVQQQQQQISELTARVDALEA